MNNILSLRGVTKRFPTFFPLKDLSLRFPDFTLEDVSFDLPEGFVMGLVGKNGAGKTTIIKSILNMLRLNDGSISVFGRDHLEAEREIKARIGVVMDYTFFVEDWTPDAVERAVAPFYPAWEKETYRKLLVKFSINPKKKIKELSRGMKMKLTTAVALSHGADLLILDEPTSGLDPVARDELLEILRDYMSGGNRSILFSTHITSDLEKIADYITFIDNGKIMASQPADDFLGKYFIVRGGLGILDEEQKKLLIGYREHSVGFDGLIERALLPRLPPSVVAEPGNLDETIIRLAGRRNGDE
ncbi:MAG: ABC transporter ATP-binding protein [Acidobacteriota bacterium]|jgi:ABC-2 type transport system ATP-binding protein|nr:ABC transporter ATP-binding protein [Acidobacteriota bacterium]